MIENSFWRLCASLTICLSIWCASMALASVAAAQESAGLVVVIANEYDGFIPSATRDANAVADKLEGDGFDAVRLLDVVGGDFVAELEKVRVAAERAGSLRIIYATGFGMCLNETLVVFTEDAQPEQFKSGQIGDVVVPLAFVAEAAATGGAQTLIVFDVNPNQCTRVFFDGVKLPPNSALLITTGIGGDVVEEVNEDGMSAFVTAFIHEYAPDRALNDIIVKVVEQIRELTDERQMPLLIGDL